MVGCLQFHHKVSSFYHNQIGIDVNYDDSDFTICYEVDDSIKVPLVKVSDLGYEINGDTTDFKLVNVRKGR